MVATKIKRSEKGLKVLGSYNNVDSQLAIIEIKFSFPTVGQAKMKDPPWCYVNHSTAEHIRHEGMDITQEIGDKTLVNRFF